MPLLLIFHYAIDFRFISFSPLRHWLFRHYCSPYCRFFIRFHFRHAAIFADATLLFSCHYFRFYFIFSDIFAAAFIAAAISLLFDYILFTILFYYCYSYAFFLLTDIISFRFSAAFACCCWYFSCFDVAAMLLLIILMLFFIIFAAAIILFFAFRHIFLFSLLFRHAMPLMLFIFSMAFSILLCRCLRYLILPRCFMPRLILMIRLILFHITPSSHVTPRYDDTMIFAADYYAIFCHYLPLRAATIYAAFSLLMLFFRLSFAAAFRYCLLLAFALLLHISLMSLMFSPLSSLIIDVMLCWFLCWLLSLMISSSLSMLILFTIAIWDAIESSPPDAAAATPHYATPAAAAISAMSLLSSPQDCWGQE